MLVELAIGDAYGAGFEYSPDEFVTEHNALAGYVAHPRHRIAPGHYTDDTQMTLAIAESLLSGEAWTRENLADRFTEAFHRDPRVGYSSRIYQLLRDSRTGQELLRAVDADSDRSGAAMRVAPLGLLPDIDDLLHRTEVQARITHDTPAAVAAAQAAALTVHYCHYRLGPTPAVADWLNQRLPEAGVDWAEPWRGGVGAQGVASVRAALTALRGCRRLTELLRVCIGYTGDVDTVATIALAAASRATDVEQDLPRHLHDTLENGLYGRDYLVRLDHQLFERWPA